MQSYKLDMNLTVIVRILKHTLVWRSDHVSNSRIFLAEIFRVCKKLLPNIIFFLQDVCQKPRIKCRRKTDRKNVSSKKFEAKNIKKMRKKIVEESFFKLYNDTEICLIFCVVISILYLNYE